MPVSRKQSVCKLQELDILSSRLYFDNELSMLGEYIIGFRISCGFCGFAAAGAMIKRALGLFAAFLQSI